jgi:hypothetical protein
VLTVYDRYQQQPNPPMPQPIHRPPRFFGYSQISLKLANIERANFFTVGNRQLRGKLAMASKQLDASV